MGLGDAKLALSLGALLGLLSWEHVFVATGLTYLAALAWGIGLLVRGRDRRTAFASAADGVGCRRGLGRVRRHRPHGGRAMRSQAARTPGPAD